MQGTTIPITNSMETPEMEATPDLSGFPQPFYTKVVVDQNDGVSLLTTPMTKEEFLAAGGTISVPVKLHIERRSISVRLLKLTACGGVEGEFEYELKISHRLLDNSGFVYEVSEIANYIERCFYNDGDPLKASCEQLCQGLIHCVLDLMPEATDVTAKVWNLYGYVESSYDRYQHDKPPFPAEPTAEELETSKKIVGRSAC